MHTKGNKRRFNLIELQPKCTYPRLSVRFILGHVARRQLTNLGVSGDGI